MSLSAAPPAGTALPMARTLYDIAHALSAAGDADAGIRHGLALLARLVPYDRSAVLEARPGRDPWLVLAPEAPHERTTLWNALGRYIELLADEPHPEAGELPPVAARLVPWPSHLAVPLLDLEQVIGVLFVGQDAPEAYGDEDLSVLSVVASQFAAHLTALHLRQQEAERAGELARLYEAEQSARAEAETSSRRLRAVQHITDAALAHLTLDRLLHELLACIRDLLPVDGAAVLLLDHDGQHLVVRAASGLGQEVAHRVRVMMGQGIAGRIATTGQPMIIADLSAVESLSPYGPMFREVGVRSLLGVPLVVEDRVLGVVYLVSAHPRRFSGDDARLLRVLADRIALAVDRARLYETERHTRADAEKLAAEWRAVLTHIADGVVIADAAGRVTFMNEAARKLFGASGGAERLPTAAEAPLQWAARQGESVLGTELRLEDGDGGGIVAVANAAPVVADDDTRLGAVLTVRDVTERHELERQKNEFFASVSHDLRTPVATIKASIEVVRQHVPPGTPEPLHRLLLNIDREADRMGTLVDDLLELARIRTGHVELRRQRHDLRAVAERAAHAIRPLAEKRGQRVQVELPPRSVPALVDAQRLERALLNLLSNAQKHGRDGGCIRVRLEQRRDEVLFGVTDDGPGIPKAQQARLFERHYRADTEETRRTQGSGLGLPIARGMAELHGGRLWVESEPGAGSTFWLAVPASLRRRRATK